MSEEQNTLLGGVVHIIQWNITAYNRNVYSFNSDEKHFLNTSIYSQFLYHFFQINIKWFRAGVA